jgi:hypothetical protein
MKEKPNHYIILSKGLNGHSNVPTCNYAEGEGGRGAIAPRKILSSPLQKILVVVNDIVLICRPDPLKTERYTF